MAATEPSETAAAVAAQPSQAQRLAAEVLGTFLLVFGSIGTALFAAGNVGQLGVALAFGLTVFAGAAAWGTISGGHFNPAVTVGLAAAGRFAWRDVPLYVLAQLVGGAVGTSALFLIGLAGPPGWLDAQVAGGFASNGFDGASPGGFGIGAAIAIEIVLTAVFVLVILGATHAMRGSVLAALVIGLTLTLIHLVSIPIDNTSVNPARSIATAIFGGAEPLAQLWVFIVFPLVGGLLGGWLHRGLFERRS
ncbi:MAG: aquaporin [Microbacteriaceae bacterium]|nr:aquaporin [Microbacteriaceae bacterium]